MDNLQKALVLKSLFVEESCVYFVFSASFPFSQEMVFIRQPIGVCGMITPWNFPNAMITRCSQFC